MLRAIFRCISATTPKYKAAVVLTGCGAMDGAEIHEATSALISLDYAEVAYQCYAPNFNQHHTINHMKGEETKETRNILEESARIARGKVKDMAELKAQDYDMLVIPGGFGVAKNLSNFAFAGDKFEVHEAFEKVIMDFYNHKKVMAFCCISPLIAAKVLNKNGIKAKISMGSKAEPCKFAATIDIVKSLGHQHIDTFVQAHSVDEVNKIYCTPCYMYSNATPAKVYRGILGMISNAAASLGKPSAKPIETVNVKGAETIKKPKIKDSEKRQENRPPSNADTTQHKEQIKTPRKKPAKKRSENK
jgi:enhancing lycopene biosynthesis protein 2